MDAEEKKPEPTKKVEEKQDDGWHLPAWVRDITKRVLYVVVPALVISGGALWNDNIRHKENIVALMDRMSSMESRQERSEARQDRKDERDADKAREDQEFQGEVLERLRKLLTGKR